MRGSFLKQKGFYRSASKYSSSSRTQSDAEWKTCKWNEDNRGLKRETKCLCAWSCNINVRVIMFIALMGIENGKDRESVNWHAKMGIMNLLCSLSALNTLKSLIFLQRRRHQTMPAWHSAPFNMLQLQCWENWVQTNRNRVFHEIDFSFLTTQIFSSTKTRHPKAGVQDDLVLVTKFASLFLLAGSGVYPEHSLWQLRSSLFIWEREVGGYVR